MFNSKTSFQPSDSAKLNDFYFSDLDRKTSHIYLTKKNVLLLWVCYFGKVRLG